MIASLNGLVLAKSPAVALVDVNGVGYEVFISSRTYDSLPALDHACFLYVQTVVREDAITLYGFGNRQEKELFLLLVTVSGIGPKLALTILSGIGVSDLCQAIMLKDFSRLTAISGVGKKTAERICVELSEKVGAFSETGTAAVALPQETSGGDGRAMTDAVSALVNLGYPQYTAWQALRAVQQQLPESSENLRVEELIRLALRALAAR